MYHGGCPPLHDATSWGTVHANGKLVTCLWQDSSVSFEGFLEVIEYRHHFCTNMIKYKVNYDFPGFSIGPWLVGSTWWVCESRPRPRWCETAQDECQDPEAHDTAFLLTFFECFEKGDIIEELCYRHHWHEKYENKEVNALNESE